MENVLVDGGYTESLAAAVKDIIGATVEVVKRNELHIFSLAQKVGGAILRLARKIPPPLEKLRAQTQQAETWSFSPSSHSTRRS